MLKKPALLGLAAILALAASASVPSFFTVKPSPDFPAKEIKDISITFTAGTFGNEITPSFYPDVRVDGVPMSVTYHSEGADASTLVYTLENAITEPGEYTIWIGEGSFTYDEYFDWDSPELEWTVRVVPGDDDNVGVDAVQSENSVIREVYRIDGTRVINPEALSAGIYIIGGKKKVVMK